MALHLNKFNTIGSGGPTLIPIEKKYTVNIHNALIYLHEFPLISYSGISLIF